MKLRELLKLMSLCDSTFYKQRYTHMYYIYNQKLNLIFENVGSSVYIGLLTKDLKEYLRDLPPNRQTEFDNEIQLNGILLKMCFNYYYRKLLKQEKNNKINNNVLAIKNNVNNKLINQSGELTLIGDK